MTPAPASLVASERQNPVRSSLTRLTTAVLTAAVVIVLAACGGSSSNSGDGGGSGASAEAGDNPKMEPVTGQKKGGAVKLLSSESFSHLDPGIAYFQLDYMVVFATHRALYYFKPEDPENPVPDIADGMPVVSADGKTVTIKIKPGIKYGTNDPSSSINGKTVTAEDIKYAIERTKNANIAGGYTDAYFPIVGLKDAKGGPVSGIETPDDHTLVLKLTKNFGATTAKALVMPISVPVPKAYAEPYDKKNPPGLDADPTKQAFSGPYMIKAYSPGKSIELVRNPEWNGPETGDPRPAYLDTITWQLGADANVAGRQIFSGKSLVNGDTPAQSAVKEFATKAKDQISFTPLGNRWVSLNYQKPPFNNLNVRRAAAAVLDRTAMQRVRGGSAVGFVANHLLPPGVPGFEESGGMDGTGADFLKSPGGDLQLAMEYMKKAGYPSGKAPGTPIVLVGDNTTPAKENALILQNSLEQLGFRVKANLVDHSVFYSKYCQVDAELKKIDVCANFGWLPDFPDPYAMLYVNFNGTQIFPSNSNNPSRYDNPKINAAMDAAAQILDPAKRADAWGQIDRQLTDDVAAIPWFWDKTVNIESKNVQGVIAQWNAAWDVSYISLK
jgi:peptide/nickel transport system substrate-binding protein